MRLEFNEKTCSVFIVKVMAVLAILFCGDIFGMGIESAQAEEGDNTSPTFVSSELELKYQVDDAGKAIVTGTTNPDIVSLEIPSQIDGHEVIEIAEVAFSGHSSLIAIKLPDTIQRIEDDAFYYCAKLESVKLPNNPNTCELGDAFEYCSSLKSITIPATITTTHGYYSGPFKDSGIQTAILAPDMKEIPDGLFAHCDSLINITCPSALTRIRSVAFKGCTALTRIELPNSLESIGESAFEGCLALTSINLPDTIKKIERDAFSDCSTLASVKLPNNPNTCELEWDSFENCLNLKNITVPATIITSEKGPFEGSGIQTAIFAPDMKEIPNNLFAGCKFLTNITWSSTLMEIGDSAFRGCSALTAIELPDSIQRVGDFAFSDCSMLELVKLPNNPNTCELDSLAFENCSNLKSITVPATITTDYFGPFENSGLQMVILAPDMKEIPDNLFAHCDSLTKITWPSAPTKIGFDAFEECTSLTRIELPDTIESIQSGAFAKCSALTSIELPDTIKEIGHIAFSDCSMLKFVKLPNNPNSCELGECVFENCLNLQSIAIPATIATFRTTYRNTDGPFSGSGIKTAILASDMKEIPYELFDGCKFLTSVTWPSAPTKIGWGAFEECSSLTQIELPNTIESIESLAFYGCSALTSIELPDTIESIGSGAFSDCLALESVKLPNNPNTCKLSSNVFGNCSNLKSIIIPATIMTSGYYGSPFSGSGIKTAILASDMKEIPYELFDGCEFLTSVTWPNAPTKIGYGAFRKCSSLTQIELPNTIESIESLAFYGCSNLQEITIPSTVVKIGDNAFDGCDGLKYVIYPKSKEDWDKIIIGDDNKPLGNAQFFFNGETGGGYIAPPTAPVLSANTSGHKQIELRWSYEGDRAVVKRFALMRSYDGIDYSFVHNFPNTAESFTDAPRFIGNSQICYYRLYAYDKYDRAVFGETSIEALSLDHELPVAKINLPQDSYAMTEHGVAFSGAMSSDNDGIESYSWSFGDGIQATGRDVEHSYKTAGEYEASLTVTDSTGNSTTETVKVRVIDKLEDGLTMLTLKICNADNEALNPVEGAQITMASIKEANPNSEQDTAQANEIACLTDANGEITKIVENGAYSISVMADGFVPRTIKLNANGGKQDNTIGITTKNIMSGELTVSEMTYDEIVAAGIDTNAEGNQHVSKFRTELTFVAGFQEYEIPIEVHKNEKNEVVGTNGGWFSLGGGGGGGGGSPIINLGVFPISEKFLLVIYGETHWLKEMYKVELIVLNNSATDTLEDVNAELMLPDGMSLADMLKGSQSTKKHFDSIATKSNALAEWYLRGDKEGDYTLKAEVSATTMPYGETLAQTYETANPVHVYAGSALHMTITCPDMTKRGSEYTVTYRIENVSDKSLYNLSFGIKKMEQYKVVGFGKNETATPIAEPVEFGEDWTRKVDELAPGGYIELKVSTTIWFKSSLELLKFVPKVGAFVDVAYYLQDVDVVFTDDSTTEIPYTINVERAERPHLIDKLIDIGVGRLLKNLGVDISGSLGSSVIELLGEEMPHEVVSGATTLLSLQQGETDYTMEISIDDGTGGKHSVENSVVRLTAGTWDQGIVDILNGTKLKVGATGAKIEAKAPGSTKLKIALVNSFGEREQEYVVDFIVADKEVSEKVTWTRDSVSAKYRLDANNFEASVERQRQKELVEYALNPFQSLSDPIEIDLRGQTTSSNFGLNVSASQLDLLRRQTATAGISVKGKLGNVTYSREALDTISEKGGDVEFYAEKYSNDQTLAQFGTTRPVYVFTAHTTSAPDWNYSGGPVKIEIPYEIDQPGCHDNILIRHIKEDGSEEMLHGYYEEEKKMVAFTTTSFSYFEVMGEMEDEDIAKKVTDTEKRVAAIPNVVNLTIDDEDTVVAAEAAYASLSENEKSFVSEDTYNKLLAARARIDALKSGGSASDPEPQQAEIGISLTGHEANISEDGTIKLSGIVNYSGLVPGNVYEVVGSLHVREETGNGVFADGGIAKDKDGREITFSREFVPGTSSGTEAIEFGVDAQALDGKTVVVFAELNGNGIMLCAANNDISSADQAISVHKNEGSGSGNGEGSTGGGNGEGGSSTGGNGSGGSGEQGGSGGDAGQGTEGNEGGSGSSGNGDGGNAGQGGSGSGTNPGTEGNGEGNNGGGSTSSDGANSGNGGGGISNDSSAGSNGKENTGTDKAKDESQKDSDASSDDKLNGSDEQDIADHDGSWKEESAEGESVGNVSPNDGEGLSEKSAKGIQANSSSHSSGNSRDSLSNTSDSSHFSAMTGFVILSLLLSVGICHMRRHRRRAA